MIKKEIGRANVNSGGTERRVTNVRRKIDLFSSRQNVFVVDFRYEQWNPGDYVGLFTGSFVNHSVHVKNSSMFAQ